MKFIIASRFLIVLLIASFFISCLSTGETITYQYFITEEEKNPPLDVSVELPEVDLFVSAPLTDESENIEILSGFEVIVPEETVPEIIVSVPVVQPEPEKKTEQISTVSPVSVVSKTADTADPEVEVVEVEAEAPRQQLSDVEDEQEYSIVFIPGENILIDLENEGWIFDREQSSRAVNLINRTFNGGITHFVFSPDGKGPYILRFILQNSETGDDERIVYNLETDETIGMPEVEGPVIIDAVVFDDNAVMDSDDNQNLIEAVEEENVPGIVASIDQLTDPESDPGTELLFDVFQILERQGGYDQLLVNLAENAFYLYPYDSTSAEMLFRAAQSLEKPGSGQDIEKAVLLFKLVRDYYPLSVYSDRSEERISYLERHFMKIY